MATENLRDDLAAIPGVASAEVTIKEDETPVARVWLDGTKDGTEVRELVGALLGKNVPDLDETTDDAPRRRGGLGRGLVDLLPEDHSHPVPSQLQPDVSNRPSVATVSVVESSSGVFVTVTDNKDREASVSVGDHGSIDAAVISAVRKLFGIDDSIQVSVEDLDVSTGSLLVASASDDVSRSAGAAFVEFGRPSAVARAVFQAMAGMP
ncbi:MAG: hypothetical protein BMS9Abin17_1606 [Acidimicrobiia bacterium]|nr:MAG: hypothetical protein BMS9Abin17_1606 [Acidimicrobiia bacterium]